MKIEATDYPFLYRSADAASLKAQRAYLFCFSLDLFLIVCSGAMGAISLNNPSNKFGLALALGVCIACGLTLTLYIRVKQFEQTWFDGRAIAESVKTRTWSFMVCGEPFFVSLSDEQANTMFSESLRNVINERKRFVGKLLIGEVVDTQITEKMSKIRKEPFEARIQIYIDGRLVDQKNWYSIKAAQNLRAANFLFSLIILAQGTALVSSFFMITYPEFPIGIPSVLAAFATALVAWLQLKRYQELSNSYALAAQELSFIAEQIKFVTTEGEFATFVSDAENAISREHTLWIARRDSI